MSTKATFLDRVKMAHHVLRGKPLIYGVTFECEIRLPSLENLWIYNCTFIGKDEMPNRWQRLWRRIRRVWWRIWHHRWLS